MPFEFCRWSRAVSSSVSLPPRRAPTPTFQKGSDTRKSSRGLFLCGKGPLQDSVLSEIVWHPSESSVLKNRLPPRRTAAENVYTLLQPPRSAARVGSPNEGSDGKLCDGKASHTLSPAPVPGIPHPCVGGSKHPFYSPREVQLAR